HLADRQRAIEREEANDADHPGEGAPSQRRPRRDWFVGGQRQRAKHDQTGGISSSNHAGDMGAFGDVATDEISSAPGAGGRQAKAHYGEFGGNAQGRISASTHLTTEDTEGQQRKQPKCAPETAKPLPKQGLGNP